MIPDVRSHHEGSIYRRTIRRARTSYSVFTAAVTMPGARRTSASCPHRHGPRDRECREVREALQRLLERRDAGTPDPRKIRVGPYLRAWIETVNGLAPATMRQHEQIIRNHLEPAFGRMMLSDLNRNHVNAYLAASPLHPQTLRHHRATLRLVLAGAVGDRLITANAASLASAPKLPDVERRWLTSAQCKALIEGTRDTRLWAFWVLAITTGLREAEMLGLTWEDVDLGDARAHLDGREESSCVGIGGRGWWRRSACRAGSTRDGA
jgi:integrase